MKNLYHKFTIAVLLAAAAFAFTGCKKDKKDDVTPEPVVASGTITATVGGKKIVYDLETSAFTYTLGGIGTANIIGLSKGGQSIVISFLANSFKTGTYTYTTTGNFNEGETPIAISLQEDSSNDDEVPLTNYLGSKMKLTISTVTETSITGTFSGEVSETDEDHNPTKNKTTITDGAFNVTIQKITI